MIAFNLLLLLVVLCGLAVAQESMPEVDPRAFKHPLTDMPGSAEDVITSSFFPAHPDHKLPIGEIVTTLCHFTNTGTSKYNVSAIMGSLNAPYDFHHHFQNYSYKPVGMIVDSGEEISLKYTFQLHPELEPVDYQLAVTVFYESETESFSTTFFNQTVELYSPIADYDAESVVAVMISLTATVAVFLIAFFACFPDAKLTLSLKKQLKKVFPQLLENPGFVDVNEDEEDDDWTHEKTTKKNKRKND